MSSIRLEMKRLNNIAKPITKLQGEMKRDVEKKMV